MSIMPETLYWITRLDSIRLVASIFCFCSVLGITMMGFMCFATEFDEDIIGPVRKLLKYFIPTAILSGLLIIFMPTTKEMLVIYGVPAAIEQSQKVIDTFGDDATEAIKGWLKKQKGEDEK